MVSKEHVKFNLRLFTLLDQGSFFSWLSCKYVFYIFAFLIATEDGKSCYKSCIIKVFLGAQIASFNKRLIFFVSHLSYLRQNYAFQFYKHFLQSAERKLNVTTRNSIPAKLLLKFGE